MSAESRIVTMKFDNTSFNRGVSQTMTMMDRLKASMNMNAAAGGAKTALGGLFGAFSRFTGLRNPFGNYATSLSGVQQKAGIVSRLNPFSRSVSGLSELQRAEQQFNTSSMTGAVTGVSRSFVALSTVAVTALATITTHAVQAGAQFANAFTLAPVIGGFKEYETQLNSVQTILANTGKEGKEGLAEVNGALDELNHYADKTIYNFSEMARNIGTFTAAGVDLETSVASIKGIANLAAISGSSSQQASTAMYQLSQALASGKVSLMDWNSVVNAGMGGKVFQTALARTATTMGTLNDNAVKTVGPMDMLSIKGKSFRESISSTSGDSWLTSDVLTSTLKQLSGDMTTAQLKAEGFTDAQIEAIQKMGKTGQDAATKVKTLTQLIDTTKEAISSGWAQTFEVVFGNFTEAKKLWTDVSSVIGDMVGKSSDARNKMLTDWKKMGGRGVIIEALSNAFHALMDILKPIKDAFHDIFPAMTADRLMELTRGLRDFTASMSISDETANLLRRTFRGVFAVFSIIGGIIKGVVGTIFDLVGALGSGEGGILNFSAGLGDFLVSLEKALNEGGLLKSFFEGLGAVLQVPVRLLGAVAGWIGDLFSGFDGSKADHLDQSLSNLSDGLTPLQALVKRVKSAFEGLGDVFGRIGDFLAPIGEAIANVVGDIWDKLAEAFGGNYEGVLDALNTGIFAAIALMFRNFTKNGGINFSVLGTDVGGAFDAITGSLEAMQANIQASTMMKLAIAIGILTASVVALSMIDSGKLTKALTAMSVGFGQLLAAMAILVKVSGSAGFLKVPMIAGAMILLSTSILILTAAVKNLSDLSWRELLKGLTGVAALLGLIVAAAGPLSAASGGLMRAGAGILLLSIGIRILANAMEAMGKLKWEEIAKGLVGMAGALVIIAGAMHLMPKGMIMQATALIAVSVALNLIGLALKQMGGMSWEEIAKGLVAMGGALLVLAGGLYLMTGALPGAAALVIAAGALMMLAPALRIMGGMGWEAIAKGLVLLTGSLLILAGGLYLMTGALPGAAALVVAAGALMMLAPVMVILGSLSWEAIGKGLVALAGAFLVIGVAGLLLAPVVPAIIGLGAAILLLGGGLALAGAGLYFIAKAFRIVASAGQAGVKVLIKSIDAFIKAIPKAAKAFAKGLLEFVKMIGRNGAAFVKAFSMILSSILKAVIKNTPLIVRAFLTLILGALKVITVAAPRIYRAGLDLILGFLRAIREKIPRIIDVAADIVVKFINGISRNIGRVVDAGVNLIIRFVNGVANAIDNNSERMGEAGGRLAVAIVRGMANGISAGLDVVIDAAKGLASSALEAAKGALGISSPSKEFDRKVGRMIPAGIARGVRHHKGRRDITDSIVRVNKDALKRARRILRRKGRDGLANDLISVGRRRARRRDDHDPVRDHNDNSRRNRNRNRRDREREYVRVDRDALERARRVLRQEHHKHLAELLKPKRPPRIRPVLDTKKAKSDAKKLGNDIQRYLNPHVSSGTARRISADKRASREPQNRADPNAVPVQQPVQYVQNNYSPKALNPVEIYRNTNNQLSKAKEGLKK